KVIVQDRKDYYEVTSCYRRKTDSDSWVNFGKPKEGTLEETVLSSALRIAHERRKKRTRVIIKLD
ncbi:MAG: hypothetical protein KKF46_04020, partial [Nanoarchaeota archaeon]|nr:hypothetical protein [Nanoarchaeota archaeon]MBU1597394.1 hypothetical protein [Nanoarchaeota archaeon]MBU2441249.1 hypothetical protein [Nanoarchaeota archaeon]